MAVRRTRKAAKKKPVRKKAKKAAKKRTTRKTAKKIAKKRVTKRTAKKKTAKKKATKKRTVKRKPVARAKSTSKPKPKFTCVLCGVEVGVTKEGLGISRLMCCGHPMRRK
jgi:hypothetical protein